MIIPDKKNMATVILAKLNGDKTSQQEVKPELEIDENDEALKAAAEDVMQAFKDQSPHTLMIALKSFIDLCKSTPDQDEES